MIVNHYKEKAFNAIIYFLNHTSLCNKKKLYKLLYLFDFEHFEQTGRNVTGFDYFAWKMGPVPTELHEAIESNDEILAEYFNIERALDKRGRETITLQNKKPFDGKYFSRRELNLLSDLSDRFELMNGDEMEAFTHREGMPWHRVWVKENRRQAEIPYEYSLDKLEENDRNIVLNISQERKAILENYQ